MDCTRCAAKSCRKGSACSSTFFDIEKVIEEYHTDDVQRIVNSSARLVDNGKAGQLSRMEEIIEFAKSMRYKKIGLAYCYGMEVQAAGVANYIRNSGLELSAVSCTVGALPQDVVNEESEICNVSCNPLGQAKQLNNERIDMSLAMGLCLNKYINTPVTTLVVKDRVYAHNPLAILTETKLTV